MPKPNQKSPDGNNDEMAMVIIFVVLIGIGYLAWMKARTVLILPVYALDWLQYEALGLVGQLGPHGLQMQRYVGAVVTYVINPKTVSFEELRVTQLDVGHRMRFVMMALIGVCIWLVASKMKGAGFKRQFTLSGVGKVKVWQVFGITVPGPLASLLDFVARIPLLKLFLKLPLFKKNDVWKRNGPSFMSYQAEHWAVSSVGAAFNPDEDELALRQAMTPPEWMEANKVTLTEADGLDDEAAEAALGRQLGNPWAGIEQQALELQALAVMCWLNYDRAGDKLELFRNGVAAAYSTKNLSRVRDLVAPYMADEKLVAGINEIGSKHYHTHVAMMALVGRCGPFEEWGGGQSAVLAPAMYLWLKRYNRPLFYALQNHGRRAFFVEGAGVVSHFFHERLTGNPISEPQMGSALDGLEKYLDYHALTDLERFMKKMKERR